MSIDDEKKELILEFDFAGKILAEEEEEEEEEVIVISLKDITERKKREEALRNSEEKYRSLFENMLSGFAYCKILVDEDNQPIDFVHLEVNDAWERSIGLKREDVAGKKVTEVIPGIKESETDLIGIYGKVALTGEEVKFDLYFEPLGKWFTISVYSPQKGYFVTVFENITERKRAEEKIQQSEEKYRFISENSKDVICLHQPDGRYIYVSPSCKNILGYDPEKLIGTNPWELVHPEDLENLKKESEKVLKGESIFLSYRIRKKSGEYIWFESINQIIRDDSGNIIHSVSTSRDITERKWAEEALSVANEQLEASNQQLKASERELRESEEKYHSLVENAPSVLWKTSEKGITVFMSSNIKEVYGYTPEEIYADGYNSWFGRIHHDDLQEVEKSFQRLFSEGKKYDVEYRIKNKDGEWIWAHNVASVVHEENGERYAYGVFTDITERKRAEDRIKQLSTMVEQSSEGMARADLNGNLVNVNEAWAKMHGYETVDDLIGKHLSIFHNKKQMKEDVEPFNEEAAKKGFCRGEVGHIRKDGTPFPTIMVTTMLKDENGRPIGMMGIAKDITERKQAEEALQKNQSLLNETGKMAKVGGWEFDVDTLEQVWTKEIYRIHEVDLDYKPTVEEGINFYAPESRPIIANAVQKIIDNGEPYDMELRFITAKGNHLWVHAIGKAHQQRGKTIKVFGTFQDITERKQAEEEITNKNKELEDFAKIAVGRELKMVELKKEINAYLKESGKEPRYKIAE